MLKLTCATKCSISSHTQAVLMDTRLAMLQPRTQCFVRDWVSELVMMCISLIVGRRVCLAQPWREDSGEADEHGARGATLREEHMASHESMCVLSRV